MTLKSDTKLEEKLICCFKNDKNLANFDPSAKKSEMCISTKYIMFELQSTEELCFMTLKSDTKFEEKLTCGLENGMRNLANFYKSTQKSQKWDSHEILQPKQKMYDLKIYRGVTCGDDEE